MAGEFQSIFQNLEILIDSKKLDDIMQLCLKKGIKILRKEEVYYAKHTLVSSRNKKTYNNVQRFMP